MYIVYSVYSVYTPRVYVQQAGVLVDLQGVEAVHVSEAVLLHQAEGLTPGHREL